MCPYFKMSNIFEFLADCRNSNSSVEKIEVRGTTTESCSKHQSIFYHYFNGNYTSAKFTKAQRAEKIEWTQDIVLASFDSIKFDVTNYCPGVQDLARCIFNQEHQSLTGKPIETFVGT